MTRPAPSRRAARPGLRIAAGVVGAGLLAACAALTLAGSPARRPARPAVAVAVAGFSTPVLLAAHQSSPSFPAACPSPVPAPVAGSSGGTRCGFLDVSCEIGNAISSWFAALARDALRPLLTLFGETLLSAPQAGTIPAVHAMWATSLAIADSASVLLVIIGGVIVMGHETMQTSYSAKDIAPRLVTGFLAANLSLILISQATTIANALSAALAGNGVTAAGALLGALTSPLAGGGVFLPLLALAGAVLALVLVVVYVLRLMALVLLAAVAPLALACYALPQTGWAARWWWRALTACLAIQVAQALVLTAAVRVFSSAGWISLRGGGPGLLPVLTAICLLYIMMRIPWWISRPVLSPFGPSPVRRTIKFAFYAAVLSRVSPLLRGAAGARRPPSGAGGRGRGPAGPRGGGPGGGGPAGPRGGRPRGPAAALGGGPGTRPGTSTGPGSGQPGGSGPGRGQPGGTGPGRRRAGGPAPQRPGSGPGPRRSPGPQQRRARPAAQAQPVARQPRQVPALPGRPPRPPGPGQPVLLPSGVTGVPRSGAPGARPTPAAAQRPARPARPPLPPAGRPRQLPKPSCPPPARQPGAAGGRPQPAARRQAPAAPRAARPGR